MRRIIYLFSSVMLALFLMSVHDTFASAQDFYFEDFTADYYLTKLDDGTSNLHVKEVLTAIFPYTDQNHGISRSIPFTNQNGKNRTIASQGAMNLTVLRNGEPEEINKIETGSDYYTVYIGDADVYVHGEQVYTLEYDFTNVITEFDMNQNNVSGKENVVKAFQELYWDTNGTEWKQRFGSLTANVHMPEAILKNVKFDDISCYVGSYGKKGDDRCYFSQIEDGFSFSTYDLGVKENLTFAIDFKPETFKVILDRNYVLVILFVIELIVVAIVIIKLFLKWKNTAKIQRDLYRETFVAPQYQPPADRNIKVAEGEQVYLKKVKSSYVATLLELAVEKKVTIKKVEDEKKYNWSVILEVEPDSLTGPQKEMMNILAGNGGLAKGDEIPIEKHVATKYLANCARGYKTKAIKMLEDGKYLVEGAIKKQTDNSISFAVKFILFVWAIILFSNFAESIFDNFVMDDPTIVGGSFLLIVIIVVLILFLVCLTIINKCINKYSKYTENGIKLVRYLEGLELYIKMAETDRLKFLQSVEGVDTSNKGIIKLYEKMLPWASLFGAEESWAKELSKYYEIEDVEQLVNTDMLNGIVFSDMSRDINRSISSSTSYYESSGGGGSSSSSGGGGGGSSGGGGGGGGGGGW